jgi:hypothetical protein
MHGGTACGSLLLFASTFALHGQSSAAARTQAVAPQLQAFDVASIKPYTKSDMMIGVRNTDDGVTISGMPMHMIIREAFGVTNDRLLGEPGWVSTSRYDIEAKVRRRMHQSSSNSPRSSVGPCWCRFSKTGAR